MTEAPDYSSAFLTAVLLALPSNLCCFFLSSWDWLIEDLCCEAHLQHGRVVASLWKRRFCLQQVRMSWWNLQAVCSSNSTNLGGLYQRTSLSDSYKRGKETDLWKGITENFWVCARPQWSPREGPRVPSLFRHRPLLLAHGAQLDSSPTKSL